MPIRAIFTVLAILLGHGVASLPTLAVDAALMQSTPIDLEHGQTATPVTNHGTLTGIVEDTFCHRVINATVSIGTIGTTTTTDPGGRFFVAFRPSDISADGVLLVSAAPPGYVENQTKVTLNAGTEYSTTLVLKSIATRTMVMAPNTQPLVVQEPYHGWVSVPSASIQSTLDAPVSEPVTAQLTTLDPTSEDRRALPGYNFHGISADDQQTPVTLDVVAAAEINLIGTSGTRYHRLATNATIRLAVPGELLGHINDGDNIPLWYYDTSAGLWREEGIGTVQSAPNNKRPWVEGQVKHITWWSFAFPIREFACLRFRPIDATTNIPLTRLHYWSEGISYLSGAEGILQGDEVVVVGKKSKDAAHPEQVRLMIYDDEGTPNYLQRDATNQFYKVSMPGLATSIPLPSTVGTHAPRWENCQDLGLIRIGVRQPGVALGPSPLSASVAPRAR